MSLSTAAYDLFVDKLKALTGISYSNIARVTGLNVLSVERKLAEGNLVTPFILLYIDEDMESEYDVMSGGVFETPIQIGYVVEQDNVDILDILETACETIRLGLAYYQVVSGPTSIQILKPPIKNIDFTNEFNQICLSLQNGLIAGSVKIRLIYGDT